MGRFITSILLKFFVLVAFLPVAYANGGKIRTDITKLAADEESAFKSIDRLKSYPRKEVAQALREEISGEVKVSTAVYRAVLALEMREMTYGWSVEMMVKAAKGGVRIVEVPVRYRPRHAGRSKISGTVRGSFLAAYFILWTTFKHAR